jgi:hypothetical protein
MVTFLVLAAVTAERRHVDRERTELFHRERFAPAYAEESVSATDRIPAC